MKYWLLALPVALALAVPVYNRIEPAIFGFPLFYWYLLSLIPLSSLFIYLASRSGGR